MYKFLSHFRAFRETYQDFLKCLNLFAQEVITKDEMTTLMDDLLVRFPDLRREFLDLMAKARIGQIWREFVGVIECRANKAPTYQCFAFKLISILLTTYLIVFCVKILEENQAHTFLDNLSNSPPPPSPARSPSPRPSSSSPRGRAGAARSPSGTSTGCTPSATWTSAAGSVARPRTGACRRNTPSWTCPTGTGLFVHYT